jgi:hypothetical protein
MHETLVENLKRHYVGPMEENDVAFLRDMQAFLEFCIENGLSMQIALSTIAHDVNGLLRQEHGFSPKVTGYAKIVEDLQAAGKDPELMRQLASAD